MEITFNQWIEYLFDHDESKGDWRFEMDLPLDSISNYLVVEYTIEMYKNFGEIVAKYSDWQLGMGLYYLYSNNCSDLVFAFHDEAIDLELRLEAISLIKVLYRDCLAKRCNEVLGHNSEGGSELDRFNYMLWDTTPLIFCPDNPEKRSIYTELEKVFAYILTIKHVGCIESGLHGVGHFMIEHADVSRLASEYIRNPIIDNAALLAYAKNAEKGYVL